MDPDPQPARLMLSDAIAELAGLLLGSDSVDDLTEQVAVLATRTVPGVATCAITLAVADRTLTVGSSDALGRLLDEHQYDMDEGPCLQAIRTREAVIADDLATEGRWPGYPARALAHGIRAVHANPLLVRGECLGALNAYARTAHPFNESDLATLAAFTNLATAGVAGTLRGAQDVTLSDHLRAALTSRAIIDQAIGIIIGQQHITAKQAFAALRTISQTRNVRLAHVAAELVRASTDPTAPTPH